MKKHFVFLILLGLSLPTLSAQSQFAPDWQAIAQKIVQRAALEAGEKVVLVAHPEMYSELIPHLRYAIIRAGGIDLGVTDVLAAPPPESVESANLQKASASAREVFRRMLREVDLAIMLPGALPVHPPYAAMQDLLREGHGRMIHFHWSGAYPATGHAPPAQTVIDETYQNAVLNTDYRALAQMQLRFEKALRSGEIHVTTPAGTDIRFRIGSRPVTRQDGEASAARAREGVVLIDREVELPAGAVRVAPLEESVQGVIVFPPSEWSGQQVMGLKLHFENGRVTEIHADSGKEHVLAEMDRTGESARWFREFVLGFNPLLAVPEQNPWIPYYGYGAGVVRLSLGDNSELGGKVTGGYVRWNFFTDATVTVGSQTWVRDGKLAVR